MKTTLLLVVAAVILAAPVMAFHDGGVAHCNGCHTMHNSQNNLPMNVPTGGPQLLPGFGYPDLLLYANKTDLCLDCHDGDGSYHVWSADPTAPSSSAQRGGGDFVFLEEDNINDGHGGGSSPILGESAGHSVISGIHGTVADSMLSYAPGGSYPAADMACTSCHDPHGTSAYRILYQSGQSSDYSSGTIDWDATWVADGKSVFAGAESDTSHNAYISGSSDWCANCHGDFHASSGNLVHPSGEVFDTREFQVYNSYRGTSNCIDNPPNGGPCGNGTAVDAYYALVPFEDSTATTASTAGPTGSSKVVCVSCHRAHATSAPDAGRWDFNVTFLETDDGVASGSWAIPAGAYSDVNQRSLCNKCHSQDEFDFDERAAPTVTDRPEGPRQ
jgi:predicted CXXCH cytochrome family protein